MPLLTKFPYNEEGNPHWEAMKDLFNKTNAVQKYTGASYYEEHEVMFAAMEDEGVDRFWCLEYTKDAFVKGWNKTKKQYEFWKRMGHRL